MGKRKSTSYPAVRVEMEDVEDTALRSSKRRALQFAYNSVAMTLLSLRTELSSSEEAFPLKAPLGPLQPQRQAIAVKYSVSSITDDEDENKTDKVVASKKLPEVIHVGPSLTIALRKPILYVACTRRREEPTQHQQLPFAISLPPAPLGRPLPPAPLLPSLLLPRRIIPSANKS
jgi:hypothetical protein